MTRDGQARSLSLTFLSNSPALAQINSDPPAPFTAHLYSVPGVVNSGGTGTIFACTDAGDMSSTLGVEVFGPAGGASVNDAATTAISVAPGATVVFSTVAFLGLSIDANLAVGVVSKGSARILATEKKGVICSAYVADSTTAPPSFATDLSVVAKTKQRGD